MKKIVTSNIVSPTKQPFIKKSLDHMQDNASEISRAFTSLNEHVIKDGYLNGMAYILDGVVISPFNASGGYISYYGNVYRFDGSTWTGESPNLVIKETFDPVYDPIELSNGTLVNVHSTKYMQIQDTSEGSVGVASAVLKSRYLPYPTTVDRSVVRFATGSEIDGANATVALSPASMLHSTPYLHTNITANSGWSISAANQNVRKLANGMTEVSITATRTGANLVGATFSEIGGINDSYYNPTLTQYITAHDNQYDFAFACKIADDGAISIFPPTGLTIPTNDNVRISAFYA